MITRVFSCITIVLFSAALAASDPGQVNDAAEAGQSDLGRRPLEDGIDPGETRQ